MNWLGGDSWDSDGYHLDNASASVVQVSYKFEEGFSTWELLRMMLVQP